MPVFALIELFTFTDFYCPVCSGLCRKVRDLSKLHRRDFEWYVAKRLKEKGRKNVKVGKGTSDDGRDIKATWNHLIQCKCYKTQSSIGVKTVRELLGVLVATEQHGIGVICATCNFTKPARVFAMENGVQLR
jgi:HJR/Mrr/RecB family endonuclease